MPSVAAVSAGCNASDVPPIVAAAVCIKPRGLLAEAQVAKVDRPKKTSSDFATMQQLAMRLRGLLKGRDTQTLEKWLSVATNSGIHGMR